MPEDPSPSEQPAREGAVELSRRLRRVAKARLEAAQRSLDAAQRSYGSILNGRMEPDRRSAVRPSLPDELVSDNALAEDLFHDFLDTQPGIHWPRDPNTPADRED